MSDAEDYVEGDVNTLDDEPDEFDANVDESPSAPIATATLRFVAGALADEPQAVEVETSEHRGKVVLSLRVGAGDMGRVIGRRGRTAQAIRALVAAAGVRDGVTTSVDIVD